MKLALAVIAKDELSDIRRIVDTYGQYFDELCFAIDDQAVFDEVSKWEKVRAFKYEWRDDFAHKRNWLADRVQSEYYFRIDTDDDIEHPELIKSSFGKAVDYSFDVVYYSYLYSRDEDGTPNAEHWRETIIHKKEGVYWKKAIHENIFIENESFSTAMKDERIRILHNADEAHNNRSAERNMRLLLAEFEKDGDKTDPRTIAYIGRVYMGMGEYQKAIPFLERLIKKSGWDDDKYFAWVQMSECWKQLGNLDVALAACNEALEINTQFPDAFLQKGMLCIEKRQFKKALDWIMPGLVRPIPDTMFVIDKTIYGYRARMAAALAFMGIGDFTQALKYAKDAAKLAPKNAHAQSLARMAEEMYQNDTYVKNMVWMAQYLEARSPKTLDTFLGAMPENLKEDERLWRLRHKFSTPATWHEASVVIYCGDIWESWSPLSTVKGIGGSEEAVIYLSKELAKLGYEVTVFNNCHDMAGVYDGVVYRNFYEFNPKDKYNIVISWRENHLANVTARKKMVWLHDVPFKGRFSGKESETFDKIIVLSEFHKTLLPKGIPEEKIFVSANGINVEDFKPSGVLRNPKRMIYTSSYDRGIQHLLAMWPSVRKHVPDAELHLFYGWETWIKMEEKGGREPQFRNALTKLMKQDGVFEHGRVGHKQLIKEFQKSGLYVYPCHFEEISCISAMKAQACGCVPVTTDYAALAETVKVKDYCVSGRAGNKEVDNEYFNAVVSALCNPDDQEEVRKKLPPPEIFGWDKVAAQWDKELFV